MFARWWKETRETPTSRIITLSALSIRPKSSLLASKATINSSSWLKTIVFININVIWTIENAIWRLNWTSKKFKDLIFHVKIFPCRSCLRSMPFTRTWSFTSMKESLFHLVSLKRSVWSNKYRTMTANYIWKGLSRSQEITGFTMC